MQNETHAYDLVVIGGGPAGMMMAGRAGALGARVLLLEKNDRLGKKLDITGGGRCNITYAEYDTRAFLEHFPQSKKFLYSPFSQFTVEDTFTFFEERGLPLVVEARKRAFPETQRAPDVTKVMHRYVKESGVEVRIKTPVAMINTENGMVTSVTTKAGEKIPAHAVGIAAGGMATPETGSTGDSFTILEELGHTIHQPDPNIVPLTTDASWVHALAGTKLSHMQLRFRQDGKVKRKKLGKLLFTHFGISGPLVLNSAYEVKRLLENGPVQAEVDLFPETDEGTLDRRVRSLFERHKNKKLKNVLPEMFSESIAATLITYAIPGGEDKVVNQVSREERRALVRAMKTLAFPITGTLGFDKAVVADGGVDLTEVQFKYMNSRLYPNLYLIGDTLNINRPSGGFSLQLCWTTGWVAGTDAAHRIHS